MSAMDRKGKKRGGGEEENETEGGRIRRGI